MSDALFTAAEVYSGDPLRPDMDTPTPSEIVAALSPQDRRRRVRYLIAQAHSIVEQAITLHLGSHELVGAYVLFSGGNDSTTLAHIFRYAAVGAIHANTTVGIEQTRQFVRDTCAELDLPLIEKYPPHTFRELVLGLDKKRPIPRGHFGPSMHWLAYTRLKERCLMDARRDLVKNPRTQRVMYLGGRRRAESARRADVPLYERRGSIIWASPLAMWTKLDLNTYRDIYPNVPRNEVSDLIHMSGECLCGAFAHPGEREEIRAWFPDVIDEIESIEDELRAAGVPEPLCRWGHGQGASETASPGLACGNCITRGQMTFEDGAA